MKRKAFTGNKKGMELVQVGILIGIAVVIGLIFKSEITSFVNQTFDTLLKASDEKTFHLQKGLKHCRGSYYFSIYYLGNPCNCDNNNLVL